MKKVKSDIAAEKKTKEAYEKIIPELALFYGVSEFTAGKRLNDLIYSRKLQ